MKYTFNIEYTFPVGAIFFEIMKQKEANAREMVQYAFMS
jgi:hypothetical protein